MTNLERDLVLIAGRGLLPELVVESLAADAEPTVLTLPGVDAQRFADLECIAIGLENYVEVLAGLSTRGFRQVVIAGGVSRPDPGHDAAPGIWDGDDAAIRSLLKPIEELGFEIVGVQELVPGLVAREGFLTSTRPDDTDRRDCIRAAQIVNALGIVDVGQAAIVAKGVCIAVESATGTDCMIDAAASALKSLFPSNEGRMGLLYKAPKPRQEMRVDCPVVGPSTISRIADAGLRGLAVPSGGVMLLQRGKMIDIANRRRLFIWVTPEGIG